MNEVQRWEIIGVFFIVGFGTTLHFWFEWTDYWRPIALIAAVNESTWEHFKMAYWPGLFFALIEYPFLKEETNNFFYRKIRRFICHAGDHHDPVLRLHQPHRHPFIMG